MLGGGGVICDGVPTMKGELGSAEQAFDRSRKKKKKKRCEAYSEQMGSCIATKTIYPSRLY